jgi:transcriptional regulator with XRE-family HTH domain
LPQSTLASIDLDLANRIQNDPRFRERYFRAWAANEVATELRQMRKRRVLRQKELAQQAHTGQSAISRIEQQDYDGWTFKTLLNIAVALKARLRIRLEAFEDVVSNHRTHEANGRVDHGDIANDVGKTADAADIEAIEEMDELLQLDSGDSSAKSVQVVN